ncbi:type II toxin-antitoxin system RelE/ParE family toxin [Amaricoccus sp. W119]|uniref:type II toxin-antitoxin system RelE/ParE family toxin n=1 Tax=Amaricoccus sp. W119 TaxID=3391833 RepID=UPI0039A70A34
MPRLIWTSEALRGVQRCHRFLAESSPAAASRAVRAIREGMRIVEAHPGAGRPAEKMPPEFREWLIPFGDSGYVVLYRVDGELALVLAVRHQREAGYSGSGSP